MKPTIEQKALAACQEYVRLNKLIRVLTIDIGDALSGCPGTGEAPTTDESYRPTHLREFYLYSRSDWEFALERTAARIAMDKCPHCMTAHKLIQERKAARLSLGAAKRQITKLGKEAP